MASEHQEKEKEKEKSLLMPEASLNCGADAEDIHANRSKQDEEIVIQVTACKDDSAHIWVSDKDDEEIDETRDKIKDGRTRSISYTLPSFHKIWLECDGREAKCKYVVGFKPQKK